MDDQFSDKNNKDSNPNLHGANFDDLEDFEIGDEDILKEVERSSEKKPQTAAPNKVQVGEDKHISGSNKGREEPKALKKDLKLHLSGEKEEEYDVDFELEDVEGSNIELFLDFQVPLFIIIKCFRYR